MNRTYKNDDKEHKPIIMEFKEINQDELKEIEQYREQFYKLTGKKNALDIEIQDIDNLFDSGRKAYRDGEVSAMHVCWVCGVGLGELLIREFICDWYKAILENNEEVPCVGNKKHYVFPISSFEKRIETDEIKFSEGLIYSLNQNQGLIRR